MKTIFYRIYQKKGIFIPVIQKNMSFINPTSRGQLMLQSSLGEYVGIPHSALFYSGMTMRFAVAGVASR